MLAVLPNRPHPAKTTKLWAKVKRTPPPRRNLDAETQEVGHRETVKAGKLSPIPEEEEEDVVARRFDASEAAWQVLEKQFLEGAPMDENDM